MQTMTLNDDEFKLAGESFFRALTQELTDLGIPVHRLIADHLCFRVGTLAEYDLYKRDLLSHGKLLTETLVNGRPICTFLLNKPFQLEHQIIALVELPAPKLGINYASGFEHAEFVINESFEAFAARYPHLPFTESGNKSLNPELSLKLRGKQAKFHHLSLDRVIEIEDAKIKDILFDLDGTLIKSRDNIYEINRIVFSEITGREVSLNESIEKFYPEFAKLFEAFSITCPLKQREAISKWGKISVEFTYELFAGVSALLDSLAERNFRLHLWTARDEFSARHILRHHGIEKYFSSLSFANDIHSKPHHRSLKFNWNSAEKNQVIVIGDSTSDVLGAKNIGAISAGALWDPRAKKHSLIKAGAELFFHHPAEFAEWIHSKK